MLTEFGAEYISEIGVIIQYELHTFNRVYLFVCDIFSNDFFSLWNEGIMWE